MSSLARFDEPTPFLPMLCEALAAHPLLDGQRLHALTFTHGARRRLPDRIRVWLVSRFVYFVVFVVAHAGMYSRDRIPC